MLDSLMAAQHPASELIARGILDAAGIPCPSWRMVVLPDDPALGEFQKDFAGAIGVFADYPMPAKGGGARASWARPRSSTTRSCTSACRRATATRSTPRRC